MKSFYTNSNCCVKTEKSHSDRFLVITCVKQVCTMLPLLFNNTIDWVMRKNTYNTNLGINWINNTTLEDLDFVDDLALLSENHQDAQEKNY
jgi:hypothetical protein